MNLNEFTKCDVYVRGKSGGDYVYLNRKGNSVTISANLVEQLGFEKDDRVDLYRKGDTFALKKAKAGCITLCKASKSSKSLVMRGTGIILQIAPFTHGKTALPGWVENGVLFFTAEDQKLEV